jgi:hypothetical protein
MNVKDMTEALYKNQVEADKFARGVVGATINAAVFLSAYALIGGGGEEKKKRRAALLAKIEKNKWGNKYLKILPMYITAYLAVKEQEKAKGGMAGTYNSFAYSPLRNYLYNALLNRNDAFSFENQAFSALGGLNAKKYDKNGNYNEKYNDKKRKGWEKVGQIMGNYFNVDPLPYKPIKDIVDVFQGVTGMDTKADRDMKEGNKEQGQKPDVLWNITEGYGRYGLLDW